MQDSAVAWGLAADMPTWLAITQCRGAHGLWAHATGIRQMLFYCSRTHICLHDHSTVRACWFEGFERYRLTTCSSTSIRCM